MRNQATVEALCRRLYTELGQDPAELVQIRPMDGDWSNALSYEITRTDRKHARIWRRDLDDNDMEGVKNCLRRFA